MKKILRILPIITLFLLIIGTVPVKSELISDDFYFWEDKLSSYGDFVGNGVRVEYESNNTLEGELQIIKSNLEKQLEENFYIVENTISLKEKNRDINILIWNEEEKTKVQISYVNSSKEYTTNQLRKEIEQIQNIAAINIKYFNFVKVKIIGDKKQNVLEILKNNINEKTLEELNIVNGTIGKGILKDGNKINFSFMTYDTGEYLILGTPVIFITY